MYRSYLGKILVFSSPCQIQQHRVIANNIVEIYSFDQVSVCYTEAQWRITIDLELYEVHVEILFNKPNQSFL